MSRRYRRKRQKHFIWELCMTPACFSHSCTSPEYYGGGSEADATRVSAAIRSSTTHIIDKTYHQNQILGRALLESVLLLDGKIIFSAVRQKEMAFYGVGPTDLEGIVQQLTADSRCGGRHFPLRDRHRSEFKVSLRSRRKGRCKRDRQLFWRRWPCPCGGLHHAGKRLRCRQQS